MNMQNWNERELDTSVDNSDSILFTNAVLIKQIN
jgi:hypothetical protein